MAAEIDAPDRGDGVPVRFGAIGLAWAMLRGRLGTWLLACLTVSFCSLVAQAVVGVATVFALSIFLTSYMAAGELPNLVGPWFYLATLLPMVAAAAVQGVLVGGLYRMALRQLDGEVIRVSDVFSVGRSAAGMAAATAIFVLGSYVGLMAFVVPGLVFMGLFAFVPPMVVDGRVGGLAAFRRCWTAFRVSWLRATLFHGALGFVLVSGVLLLGVGVFFTFPLYVLSICAQYRRSFAPGAVHRPNPVENPYEDAVGVPRSEQLPPRIPVPAWLLIALGMSTPVLVVGGLVLLTSAMLQSLLDKSGRPGAMFDRRLAATGHGTPPPLDPGIIWPDGGIRGGPPRRSSRIIPSVMTRELSRRFRDEIAAAQALRGDSATKQAAFDYLVSLPIEARSHRDEVMRMMVPLLNDPGLADDAREVLARWATADDLPLLLEMLGSWENTRNEFIFTTGWKILERVADERTVERLGAMLVNKSDRDVAISGLSILEAKSEAVAKKYLEHPDPDARSAADRVLWKIGKQSDETNLTLGFSDLKSPDPRFRRGGLDDIAKYAPKVPKRCSDVHAAVTMALNDPNELVRNDAIDVLVEIGDEDVISHLVRALEDPAVSVRAHAMKILSREDDPALRQYFLKALNDPSSGVKEYALRGLVDHEAPEDLAPVIALLEDPFVHKQAQWLLTEWWRPDIQPEVVKLLRKRNPDTRTAACEVLKHCGDRDAIEALRLATQDSRQPVAAAARAAVIEIERRINMSASQEVSGGQSRTPE